MQTVVNPLRDAQELYDKGKFTECVIFCGEVVQKCNEKPELLSADDYREVMALLGWAYYRLKKYGDAKKCIAIAAPSNSARRLQATIAAYVDKDDGLLMRIANEMHDDAGVANALVIRARDGDRYQTGPISRNDVLEATLRFRGGDVAHANIWHNAGRYFYAKQRRDGDLAVALGFLDGALALYGDGDKNLHHRAAAHFWRSKIIEDLFGKETAVPSAQQSLDLWMRQVSLDPQNEAHKKQLENAWARMRELNEFTPA